MADVDLRACVERVFVAAAWVFLLVTVVPLLARDDAALPLVAVFAFVAFLTGVLARVAAFVAVVFLAVVFAAVFFFTVGFAADLACFDVVVAVLRAVDVFAPEAARFVELFTVLLDAAVLLAGLRVDFDAAAVVFLRAAGLIVVLLFAVVLVATGFLAVAFAAFVRVVAVLAAGRRFVVVAIGYSEHFLTASGSYT